MTAIPWYRSRILQGLLTVLVTQLISRLQSHYHIDFSVWDTSVTDIVSGMMDGISFLAISWAAHARVAPSVPIPAVVTLTKAEAEEKNKGEGG